MTILGIQNISVALGITLVIELIVLFVLKERDKRLFLILIAMNFITNPVMNIFLTFISPQYYYVVLFVCEVVVIVIESLGYYLVIKDFKKALKISLFCNVMSFMTGWLLIPLIY